MSWGHHDDVTCIVQAYYRVYKEHIPVAQLCRETAAVMQEFTRALPPCPFSIISAPLGHHVTLSSFMLLTGCAFLHHEGVAS